MKRALIILPALLAATDAPALADQLRAGASRMSITPPASAFPMLSGVGQRDKPFVGVHDDIYARALRSRRRVALPRAMS
jgi:hypothetical protein